MLINWLFASSYAVVAFALLKFTRALFADTTIPRWINWLTYAAGGAVIVVLLASALGLFSFVLWIEAIEMLFTTGACVVIGVKSFRNGAVIAGYYLGSFAVLFLAAFSLVLTALFPPFFELNQLVKDALLIGSSAEMILLALALSARMRKLRKDKAVAQEAALQTINAYNQKLELEVKARTQELSAANLRTTQSLNQVETLLNNAGEGFLSFGADLDIDAGYSRECLAIFRCDNLSGNICDLLAPNDSAQQSFLKKTLQQILNPDTPELLVETYISLLPQQYILNGRYCSARYTYLAPRQAEQASSGDLKLMMVLSDITEQKALQDKLVQERRQLEFIVYNLRHRDEFLHISKDFEVFLHQSLPKLLAVHANPVASLTEIFRQVHTFKSLFAQVCCPALPEHLHDLETALATIRDGDTPCSSELLQQVLAEHPLVTALEAAQRVLSQHLGDAFFSADREYRISASRLARVEAAMLNLPNIPASTLALIRSLRFEPLSKLLAPHFNAALKLAQRQDKALGHINYDGDDPLLDPIRYGELIQSLVHVFKNAVDHGLESIDERIDQGKSEQATLRCRVTLREGYLQLSIEDDGRGIDTSRLRAKVHDTGLLPPDTIEALSEQEAFQLIFLDGITAKDQVTSSAGRGVGLAAVRSAIEKLDGSVNAFSTRGEGARVVLSIPLQDTTYALSASGSAR